LANVRTKLRICAADHGLRGGVALAALAADFVFALR